MKISYIIVVLICLVLVSSISFAFSGGNGTVENPYIITNCSQLQEVKTYYNSNFALGNDINCQGVSFNPIGDTSSTRYRGVFDGRRFVIKNLIINYSGQSNIGLFGHTESATIKNLGIENYSVRGDQIIGGLIGKATYTTISNVYVKGSVYSTRYAGGLVGEFNGEISNSYFDGNVSGAYSGGLVGYNSGSIKNSFVIKSVSSESSYAVLGFDNYASTNLSNIHWFDENTLRSTRCHPQGAVGCVKATSLSSFYFRNYGVYTGSTIWDNNWEWNGTFLPKLRKEAGTLANPWKINNCLGLEYMNYGLDANYILENDIDCYADTHEGGILWNLGKGFFPVGDNYSLANHFKGSLNGKNFAIKGLYINEPDPTKAYIGLFGYIESGLIKDLKLIDCNVNGAYYVGCLAGGIASNSLVINSFATGNVTGDYLLGGLAGNLTSSKIYNSFYDGNVSGNSSIGGLVGTVNEKSEIKNILVSGFVRGAIDKIGGILGEMRGSTSTAYPILLNSYTTAEVISPTANKVGGIAGQGGDYFLIKSSFSAGTVTGSTNVGKIIGYISNTNGLLQNNYCLGTSPEVTCTAKPNRTYFYNSSLGVYTNNPYWSSDGNWSFSSIYPQLPTLNAFTKCIGDINSNTEIYENDETGYIPYDEKTRILSNSNTVRKCEWHCIEGYVRGSGADQNACIEIPTYNCSTFSDPNAVVFEGDLNEVPINETQSILLTDINSNTLRKCEYYCNTGYYKGTGVDENKCLPYTCLSPIANASYHPDDNTGIIKVTETKSIFSVENTQRKCEMKCDTNYVFDGNYCIYNPSSEFKCIGTIPQNAVFWTPDENKNLTKDTQITVSNTNTSEKCEYNCLSGYKKFENNCVPSNWVIGTCSTKTTYFPSESFPEGPLCIEGNPYPINPFFDEDTNIAQWVCTGDYNKACTAKRVGQDMPIVSACSILDLTAEYNYANSEGLVVNTYCSCYTKMNLTFTNYNTGEILAIAPSSVDCNTFLQKQGLGFEQEIVEDMLIQVKGSIKDNVNECTNCEAVTYLSYQLEKESSTIPDNSFICTLLILGIISFILIEKKRI